VRATHGPTPWAFVFGRGGGRDSTKKPVLISFPVCPPGGRFAPQSRFPHLFGLF